MQLFKNQALSHLERAMYFFVVAIAGLSLVFGGYYMWHHVAVPFEISYKGSRYLSADQKDGAQKQKDKTSDTDSDGLSDYDEKYIYQTSPYLKDSDSDGTEDATEVKAGTDPNCAANQPCITSESPVLPTNPVLGNTEAPTPPEPPNISGGDAAAASPLQELQNMTADDIRALLVQSGIAQSDIDKLSDEQIKALYQVALEKASAQAQQTNQPNP